MRTPLLGPATEVASRLNDAVLRAAGWYPTITAFGGYGSTHVARINCQTIMGNKPDQRDWLSQRRGWRQFVSQQTPRQPVLIRLGEASRIVYAGRAGYVDADIHGHGLPAGWHQARAFPVNRQDMKDHRRELLGERGWSRLPTPALLNRLHSLNVRVGKGVDIPVRIIGEEELVGIVSDVDDTVLVSDVPRPVSAMRHTFLDVVGARKPVPGMSSFLTALQATARSVAEKEAGQELPAPPVFYLSSGAWDTVPGLRQFLRRNGFPKGPLLMRAWWVTDAGLPGPGQEHKLRELDHLVSILPQMSWILIGDNGQSDPDTFQTFENRRPGHLAAAVLRLLTPREKPRRLSRENEHLEPLAKLPEDVPTLLGQSGHHLVPQVRQPQFHHQLRSRLQNHPQRLRPTGRE